MQKTSQNRFVEQCWTLVGQHQGQFWYARRRRPVRGESTCVEFDADWALDREESRGDVIGFYHTHPDGSPMPSQRDVRTFRAWAGCFGKPLLCLIESDGVVEAYRFDDEDSGGERIAACERLPYGVVVAFEEGDA